MHKPTFTSTLILATGILLTTLSAQGMRGASLNFYPDPWTYLVHHDSALKLPAFVNPPSPEELKELSLQAKQYNQNNPLFLLPKETLDHIFSYCHIQDDNQVKSLEKSIETFLHLSATCKNFNKLLTLEIIGSLCKNYALTDKIDALKNLLRSINDPNYKTKRLPGLILVHAGVDANTEVIGYGCLLSKAVIYSDEQMVKTLFQHHANPNAIDSSKPVFFVIRTIRIAQMFNEHGVNMYVNDCAFGTNALWYISKIISKTNPECSLELIEFYLKNNVDATQLDPKDNSCLLHRLAEDDYISNVDEFLKKGTLLLNAMPKEMVNTLNKRKQTPIDIAIASLAEAKKYTYSTPEVSKQLISLYRSYGGLTAQELAQQTALTQQQ